MTLQALSRPPYPFTPPPHRRVWRAVGLALAAAAALICSPAQAWEPTAPVELVVPAGKGGGADQMARFIQELVAKHKLMGQPINVVNRPGNSGIDGLMEMKSARGNPHKLVITLSNLFTAPLATGINFSWTDLSPVQMLALDQFVLWVVATSPYKTTPDLLNALRSAPAGSLKLGGTGVKQEDQLLSVLLETAVGTRISYVALKGGGDVARALAEREVDMTVNNPIEAEELWRKGKLRPLCVFDDRRMDYPGKVSAAQGWADLPTCMSQGIPTQYQMMRGIFTTPGATPDQVAYYNQVLDKMRALPEWQAFMARGAFKQTRLSGKPFNDWLDKTNRLHSVLMREAKLKAPAGGVAPAPAAPAAPARK